MPHVIPHVWRERLNMADCSEWPETNAALHRLESLLHCSLCRRTMEDPCSLDSCDHHFCRACILDALGGRHSVCPECGLPAWVRDLRANRQLGNLINLLHSLTGLVGGIPSSQLQGTPPCPSAEVDPMDTDLPTSSQTPLCILVSSVGSTTKAHGSADSKVPSPHNGVMTTEHTTLKKEHKPTTTSESLPNKDKDVFRKPKVSREQLIRRRLKCTPKNKPSCLTPKQLETDGDILSAAVVSDHVQPQRQPLAVVNHRRARSLPGTVFTDTKTLMQTTPTCSGSGRHHLEKPTSSHSKSFGQPKTRRRKSNPLESTTEVPEFSLEFPFSPLVTKTRNYARLDRAARVQRLQESHLPAKRSRCSAEGPQKHRRIHQLRMEAFVRVRPVIVKSEEDVLPVAPLMKSNRERACPGGDPSTSSSLHTESPVPIPPTPSSAHARTMRRNIRGETPLHIAAIKGDVGVLRALLLQGADPNAKDHAGWTPLHEACNHGHLEAVVVLLDHGALVNIPGYENDTSLHDAVSNGHVEVARLLVSRGANVSLRNRRGQTVVDLAVGEAMKTALAPPTPSPGLLISPNAIRSPHASPILNGGPSRVVLLGTGLKGYQKSQMEELADLLGAQVTSSFSPDVSHVVTVCDKDQCCPRTLKFLCGVAMGKWIVSFQWISRCLQERSWVDETPFEVRGVTVGDSAVTTEAPRRGRENAMQKAPGLFDGCEFYFSGGFPPPRASKEDLSHLVKLAGGRVLAREPRADQDIFRLSGTPVCPYHARIQSAISTCHTFIVCDSRSGVVPPARLRTARIAPVSASWLLDSLSHFELLDIPE